jgi:hypothetical protein
MKEVTVNTVVNFIVKFVEAPEYDITQSLVTTISSKTIL